MEIGVHDSYHYIWVDLESVHTLAGVVGSIIDQCRKYDSTLAPSVLAVDVAQPDPGTGKATIAVQSAKRVARALRRTRYFLGFDGLETYVWPAISHHGLTHMAVRLGAEGHLKNLKDFLNALADEDLGESQIGISVDDPKERHHGTLNANVDLRSFVNDLCYKLKDGFHRVGSDVEAFETRFAASTELSGGRFPPLPLVSLKTLSPEMKNALAREPGESDERDPVAQMALTLFILASFRRTRPLVTLRQILEPVLGSRERIDGVLTCLEKSEFLQQLEGGGFWFNRTLRDWVYEQNTNLTGTDHLEKCLETPGEIADWTGAAFQLFLSAVIHQRITRIWYTYTFVQSQDTFAFLEYTYHRLSSIRTLAKLLGLIQVARNRSGAENADSSFEGAVKQGIAACGKLLRKVAFFDQLIKQLEFDILQKPRERHHQYDVHTLLLGNVDDVDLSKIQEELETRHLRELRSLHRGWTRSEGTLRAQIPAEQLLHWCGELLEDDLKYRCNRVVVGYNGLEPIPYRQFGLARDVEMVNPKAEEFIEQFQTDLEDLRVKLWIERSDYEEAQKARCRQLNVTPDTLKESVATASVRQLHLLLDVANCMLRMTQESTATDKDLIDGCKETLALLEAIEGKLAPYQDKFSAPDADGHEAMLRLVHLRAECQFGRVSVFSHDGFAGDDASWSRASIGAIEARQSVDEGLKLIRTQDPCVHHPRSVVIDRSADGALYLQYRSVFHLLRGRVEWLGMDRKDELGNFEGAFWNFEMARGGLENHGSLLSALVEMFAVEACLARARSVLHNDSLPNYQQLARAKYESARGSLHRAREALVATRRNAIWWKLFFQFLAQYHVDRFLIGFAYLYTARDEVKNAIRAAGGAPAAFGRQTREVDEPVRLWVEKLPRLLLRLQHAYQAIRSALDLYLLRAPAPPLRWIKRMWWELTLAGYATGRLALEVFSSPLDQDASHRYVLHQLRWLNQSAGLDSDSGLTDAIDRLADESFPWRGFAEGGNPKTGRERWREIIQIASELAPADNTRPAGSP